MNKRKIIGALIGIIVFIALIASATYAFLTVNVINGTAVGGNSASFNVTLDFNAIKRSTKLTPILSANVSNVLTGGTPCIRNGYEVCSMYEIVLTNNGMAINLRSHILTSSSTYVTNNLKAGLFTYNGTSYSLVTDILTLGHNNNAINNLLIGGNRYFINIEEGSNSAKTVTYYLVIWLNDTNESQNNDQNKIFSGSIIFETVYGDRMTSQL